MHTTTITSLQLAKVTDAVADFCNDEVTYRDDYSGRGMYGQTCVGIDSTDPAAPTAFLYLLAEELGRDFLDLLADLGGGATDGMGLGVITYWPALRVTR